MRGNWLKFPRVFFVAMVLSGAAQAQVLTTLSQAHPERKKISVVVNRGITHTRQLPRRLQSTRKAMVAGRPMVDEQLIELAVRRDSLAAMRYTKRLLQRGDRAHAAEIAYFASLAAGGGRFSMFDEMVEALYSLKPGDLPKSHMSQVISVLYAHAWSGNSLALDAVIDLNGPEALFGAMSERTRDRLLATGLKIGDGRIELRLAIKALTEQSQSPQVIVGYLIRAERMGDLAVRTTAENLHRLLDPTQTASN